MLDRNAKQTLQQLRFLIGLRCSGNGLCMVDLSADPTTATASNGPGGAAISFSGTGQGVHSSVASVSSVALSATTTFQQLTWIDLSSNALFELPDLTGCSFLTILLLKDNQIRRLDDIDKSCQWCMRH